MQVNVAGVAAGQNVVGIGIAGKRSALGRWARETKSCSCTCEGLCFSHLKKYGSIYICGCMGFGIPIVSIVNSKQLLGHSPGCAYIIGSLSTP